ncbi:VCBS repeat-containing protein [Micromonospora peucetia]|uniref:FG-GAP repeat domain-containing protein n=1 Tax=Micromonospora peucetia TaxID=47871 RepID=UPI00331FEF1E
MLLAAALLIGSILVTPSAVVHAKSPTTNVQFGQAWVDFNADGKADYCSLWSYTELRCVLSTGTGLGQRITGFNQDQGYKEGRAWVDFNGDRRVDYCRVVAAGGKSLSCTLSNGTSFGSTYTSGGLDPGWTAGQAWVDFNADGRADFCRVIGTWSQKVQCTVSTGAGFGATYTSGNLDAGWDAGRDWADANGDGRADYCRVVSSSKLQCTLSTGTGFGTTFTSANLDGGWDDSRDWVDFNGDGRVDYCRVIGNLSKSVQCTLSTGNNFGSTITSAAMDVGYWVTRGWADFNGDGRLDFCRINNDRGVCTVSNGSSFGATYSHPSKNYSYIGANGWADFNGDGRADHSALEEQTTFYLSTGTGWGGPLTSPLPNT